MTTSIDGLVSGLSTSDIINQLMQLERAPQTRLRDKVTATQKVITAYQSLNTKVDALKTASASLAKISSWSLMKATSSDTAVATVTAGTGAVSGSLSFTVTSLATAAAKVSSTSVASTGTIVATGSITIQKGTDATATISVGDGSLSSVVDAINRANVGVRAAAVQVGTGAYKLQLTSTTTGSASTFTVGGAWNTALGTFGVLDAGQNAVLQVGTAGAGGYTITSQSNTVTGVLPGTTLTVKKTGATTIDVVADAEGLADKVAKVVETANTALAEVKRLTAYDAEKKTGGVLMGDSLATSITRRILAAVVGTTSTLGEAGVELTRTGEVTFDRAAFLAAYADDPDEVANAFRQGASSTSTSLSFVSATAATDGGSYTVKTTAAATQASKTGTAVGVNVKAEVIDVRVGSTQVTYNVTANATSTTIVAGLNAAFAGAGLGLVAEDSSGAVKIRTAGYGTTATFDVRTSAVGGRQTNLATVANTWQSYAGTNVAGTFTLGDGTVVAGEGTGQVLSAPADHAVLGGLTVKVTSSTTGTIGVLTYGPGVAQRLETMATGMVDKVTGGITNAVTAAQATIRDLNKRVDDWDVRLSLREKVLRRQFSALETALGRMRDQSSWLAGQLAGLPNGSS